MRVVLGARASSVPYNVLWISMDALRPDAIAAFHDDETDERWAEGKPPPLDAWLPRVEETTPALNALARESAIFTRAWSVSTWTRPGVTAMLAGMRSSELGLTTTDPRAVRCKLRFAADPRAVGRQLRITTYPTAIRRELRLAADPTAIGCQLWLAAHPRAIGREIEIICR